MSDDLRHRSLELERLGREADGLREQIREEQQRRQSRVADLTEQVITVQGQNKLLQAQLSQLQLRSSSSAADATGLKREVVAKTMELEKLVREFQQVHADLFSRAQSLSDSMLRLSDSSNAPKSNGPKQSDAGSPLRNLLSADSAPQRAEQSQFASLGPLDDETRHALKTRLQSLGDVVVFASDKFDACCASGHSIPPGAMRVRPRRCDHVFLIECLMPYWVEGLCPVCRCSFAYSRVDGVDESDRCSSVSTSVSQRAKRVSSQKPMRGHWDDGAGVGSLGSLGSLRAPRYMRAAIVERQRSSSCGARSDVSVGERGPRSPSRSGTGGTGISGSLSRTSSGHRDRPL